jgi:hypothetical protein
VINYQASEVTLNVTPQPSLSRRLAMIRIIMPFNQHWNHAETPIAGEFSSKKETDHKSSPELNFVKQKSLRDYLAKKVPSGTARCFWRQSARSIPFWRC